MPEMNFLVRWPDDSVDACYSPSLVVREYFDVGERYALADFVARSRTALTLASERVREKYGFACSNALRQLATIDARARSFERDEGACVVIEAFEPA
ncbi:MAG: MSMEG_0570 family nitrogen starvation response protein [Vulcanimicrobiaceae bacterium]